MTKRAVFLITLSILLFAIIIPLMWNWLRQPTWTDPAKAAAEDPAFTIQGDYGIPRPGQDWAIQVVALGGRDLDAHVLRGGFPGLGHEKGNPRIRLRGTLTGDSGADFPEVSAGDDHLSGRIHNGIFTLKRGETPIGDYPRVERRSPTLGQEAPPEAVVLFDGKDASAWNRDNLVENGLLRNRDISTRREFGDYTLHLEFRTPYKPFSRGQHRGNSGVYHQGRYETQVLDAFGMEAKSDGTGGLYATRDPDHNMCLPPLAWQTYDVDLTSARFDDDGTLTAPARITVRLNGVIVHDDVELTAATPGARKKFGPGPGPIFLQGHGNPVFYRNIWIVEKSGH